MTDQPKNEAPKHGSILDEFTNLGKNIGQAVQSALDSPQRYEIEDEVRQGFQTVITEINDAITKARNTDVGKEINVKVSQTAESVRSNKFTDDLRSSITKGLKALNDEINQTVSRWENRSADSSEAVVDAATEAVDDAAQAVDDATDAVSNVAEEVI